MDKPSQIESSIGIFIIIVILATVCFYGYSSYQRLVKVQEETISSLQKQLSEVQTNSIK